jgi:hypothetical protein
MKRSSITLSATLALAAAVLLTPTFKSHLTMPVVHAQTGCTNATVSGNYGLSFSGFQRQHNKSVPFYGAGLGQLDGAGNTASTFAYSLNGESVTGVAYTATYTVNSDCTVSLIATPGSGGDNFTGVIVGDGSEVWLTDISAPDTLNMNLKKQ